MHKQIPISFYIYISRGAQKNALIVILIHMPYLTLYHKNNTTKLVSKILTNSIHLLDGRKLQSIFIGGGTPSLIDPLYLQLLLEHMQPYCHDNIEVTMEVNPGSFEIAKFQDFFQAGINRLSIGANHLMNITSKNLVEFTIQAGNTCCNNSTRYRF